MTDRLAPNPLSPFANADPNSRHIFPSPIFFPAPVPGVLAPAACDLMAVVPDELIETQPGAPLPDGLCADCVTVMQGGKPPRHPSSECGSCGSSTWHGELCALCRQEKHEAWWPTRGAEEQPGGDPLAYGPTGYRCGCGKDAHSNLVPCQPDPAGEQPAAEGAQR